MVDKLKFPQWLENSLKEKEMSQSELARQAGVTRAAINGILSGARGPGTDLCLGIARAFNLPPETVYRKAGLLPPVPKEIEKKNELSYIVSQLSPQEVDDLILYTRLRLQISEQRAKYKTE